MSQWSCPNPDCKKPQPKGLFCPACGTSLADAKRVVETKPDRDRETPVTALAVTIDDWSAAVDSALSSGLDEILLGHLLYIAQMLQRKMESSAAEEARRILQSPLPSWLRLRELQYLLHPERPLMLRGQAAGDEPASVAAWAGEEPERQRLLLASAQHGHLVVWLRQRNYVELADRCADLQSQSATRPYDDADVERLVRLLREGGCQV